MVLKNSLLELNVDPNVVSEIVAPAGYLGGVCDSLISDDPSPLFLQNACAFVINCWISNLVVCISEFCELIWDINSALLVSLSYNAWDKAAFPRLDTDDSNSDSFIVLEPVDEANESFTTVLLDALPVEAKLISAVR